MQAGRQTVGRTDGHTKRERERELTRGRSSRITIANSSLPTSYGIHPLFRLVSGVVLFVEDDRSCRHAMQIPRESSHIFTHFLYCMQRLYSRRKKKRKKIVTILNLEHRAMEKFEKLMTDKKSSTIDSYLLQAFSFNDPSKPIVTLLFLISRSSLSEIKTGRPNIVVD